VSDEQEDREHPGLRDEPTSAHAKHIAYVEAVKQHRDAAGGQIEVLVSRAQTLVRNGVDLRNPERLADFVEDQVMDAVRGATVHDCGCAGAHGAAALALVAELARRLAEATR
jgi:hypothetical protein